MRYSTTFFIAAVTAQQSCKRSQMHVDNVIDIGDLFNGLRCNFREEVKVLCGAPCTNWWNDHFSPSGAHRVEVYAPACEHLISDAFEKFQNVCGIAPTTTSSSSTTTTKSPATKENQILSTTATPSVSTTTPTPSVSTTTTTVTAQQSCKRSQMHVDNVIDIGDLFNGLRCNFREEVKVLCGAPCTNWWNDHFSPSGAHRVEVYAPACEHLISDAFEKFQNVCGAALPSSSTTTSSSTSTTTSSSTSTTTSSSTSTTTSSSTSTTTSSSTSTTTSSSTSTTTSSPSSTTTSSSSSTTTSSSSSTTTSESPTTIQHQIMSTTPTPSASTMTSSAYGMGTLMTFLLAVAFYV